MDIWDQVQNPTFTADELMGSGVAPAPPPPGAGPAPALPPGYVSINSPGGAPPLPPPTTGTGPETGRPELPPGYYRLDGPPPPWIANPDAPGSDPVAPAEAVGSS